MVAQLLGLRLALLRNTFRRGPEQSVGVVVGLLAAIVVTVVAASGFVGLRSMSDEISRAILIVVGSAIVLGFLLVPLVFGADDSSDPRRFALLGIPTTRLAVGLAIAGAVSLPTAAVAVLAIAQIAAWSREPLPLFFALLAAILVIPTCALAARVSSAVASMFLASRRRRDCAGIVALAVLVVAAPALAFLGSVDWESHGLPVIRRIASFVSWLPFAAAWSAPGDAAVGDAGVGAAKLAIAAAFLVVLWLAWRGLVARAVTHPQHESRIRTSTGLGWFGRLPATPFGAIAARSLTYWARDARYRVALVVIPIVPIVMVAALLVGGVPEAVIAWIPVPVMCLFLGWIVHNDVAHDSSAFWAHVSANTRGSDDRWGRVIPALFIGVPLVVVGSLVTVFFSGEPATLPGLIGLSSCVLLAGLGISSVMSAAFPYPAVHPGDNPFAQPQAVGATGSVVQSFSFLITLVIAAPVVGLVVLAANTEPGWYLAALALGLGLGVVVLLSGIYSGARLVSRRAPELLAFTLQN